MISVLLMFSEKTYDEKHDNVMHGFFILDITFSYFTRRLSWHPSGEFSWKTETSEMDAGEWMAGKATRGELSYDWRKYVVCRCRTESRVAVNQTVR